MPVYFSHAAISEHLPAGPSFSGSADKGRSTFPAFYSSQGGRRNRPNPALAADAVWEPKRCFLVRKT